MFKKIVNKLFNNEEYQQQFDKTMGYLKNSDNLYDQKLAEIFESSHNGTLDIDELLDWYQKNPDEKKQIQNRIMVMEEELM